MWWPITFHLAVCLISTQPAPVRPQISVHMTWNWQIILLDIFTTQCGPEMIKWPVVVQRKYGDTPSTILRIPHTTPTSFMGNICHPTSISPVQELNKLPRQSKKIYFNSQMFLFIDLKIILTRTKSSDTVLTMKNSYWRFNLTVWNMILKGYDVSFRCFFP